jgi:acetoin utilization protein AcuB
MTIPSVGRYMTQQPWTIARTSSLAEAHVLMREHDIRHLPVTDGGKLVGIVSRGDLHLLETIGDFALDGVTVDEAMTPRPSVVTSDTPLDEVVAIMAEQKYGSIIVMGHDGIEGIFTMVDACKALADRLQHDRDVELGIAS